MLEKVLHEAEAKQKRKVITVIDGIPEIEKGDDNNENTTTDGESGSIIQTRRIKRSQNS